MLPSWTRAWPPGSSQRIGAWTVSKLSETPLSFQAAAVAQQLYACTSGSDQVVTFTIAVVEQCIRITARSPHPLAPVAAQVWEQQARRLADRHGDGSVPDEGVWAELDLPAAGVTP